MLLRRASLLIVCLAALVAAGAQTAASASDLYGQVVDHQRHGVAGVVVSDGYQCVTTDAKGYYSMQRNDSAKYVFYTNPEGYTPDESGYWRSLSSVQHEYNFVLGPQTDLRHFNLMVITDPQPRSDLSFDRFSQESMPSMRRFIASSKLPVVGLSLGDNVHEQHPELEGFMHASLMSLGIPFFSIPGNHDNFMITGPNAKTSPRNTSFYEHFWGPTWYSMNAGNVHFVGLSNNYYYAGKQYFHGGVISKAQLEWLRQDLSHVDKSKFIIVGYHIPMSYKKDAQGFQELLALLKPFEHRLLICGHTHAWRSITITEPITIEERVHAAMSGAIWWSTINKDGTPNGYSVYEINGNKITDNWYEPVNFPARYKGHQRDYQVRLYHGGDVFSGPFGSYRFGDKKTALTDDYVVANVWNWTPAWTVTISENGGKPVAMEWGLRSKPKIKYDAWSQGYLLGVQHRGFKSYDGYSSHLFIHKLKHPGAKVVVTATDPYGNVYRETQFTSAFDELRVNGKDFHPHGKKQ